MPHFIPARAALPQRADQLYPRLRTKAIGGIKVKVNRFAALLVLSTGSATAEKMPNPLEFIAGLAALQDVCVQRFPEMKGDAAKEEANMSRYDAEMIRLLKTSTEYPAALQRARSEVKKIATEKVDNECKSMHADANRNSDPVRK